MTGTRVGTNGRHAIARAQIFYTDFNDLAPSMEVWADAFPKDPPACTLIQVHDKLLRRMPRYSSTSPLW